MTDNKKTYQAPEITSLGSVAELTLAHNAFNFYDQAIPAGTPLGTPNITS